MDLAILKVADEIRQNRYPDAEAVFAAGSIVRGEGTAHSDLDLVVVYAALPCAYRESFRFGPYPCEAFVHDPQTLEYFCVEVDRPTGIPALPTMVAEGVEIPAANDVSRALKARAAAIIDGGPPPLDGENERRRRYLVSDLLDDLREPRSRDELLGTATQLFAQLADYYLRSNCYWSAKGKAIARALHRVDPGLSARFFQSFGQLFQDGAVEPVVRLSEDVLRPRGGILFEGYRSDAPANWRKPPDRNVEQGETDDLA
jgi:hypothetical protein